MTYLELVNGAVFAEAKPGADRSIVPVGQPGQHHAIDRNARADS